MRTGHGRSTKPGGPYFFVHLQKTGGTALNFRLRDQFPGREMYPRRSDGDPFKEAPQMSIDRLVREWSVRRKDIRLIAGHFPLCTTELLGGGFTTLTMLREPVERTLSFLRHRRALAPALQDTSLEEIYEDPQHFHWLVHNHMVKMFALRADEMKGGVLTKVEFTEAHLARATERLAAVDAVGLQEGFDEFCAYLEQRFAWQLGPAVHVNQTKAEPASDALRARIAADNALDVEFYEFARRLSATQLRARSLT